jgi:acetyl-CoA carboxylase biotin carboxylase subunit
MFKKILIANRGEVALRVLRACKEMGIATVAIYSEADKNLKHVKMADESVCIGPAESAKSYLNIPAIISACEVTDSDAIHPGVGFLAENDHFAEQVQASGYTFIGPDPESIKIMGNKISAKEAVSSSGMQCVPGTGRISATNRETMEIARKIGYPVIIKAAAGGGGKGIQIVEEETDLLDKLKLTQREALNSFGSDEIYLEKFLTSPRHVEIQIAADNVGNVIHFFERDCSIQRKNQKIIEEAPAFGIPEEKLQEIRQVAVNTCKKLNYKGLGTFEFLYENGEFYFIEMNTRLQVEHTITEMITGIDLVKLQIKIAAGEEIRFSQEEINCRGHAIECRRFGYGISSARWI